jgi:hypothetical protein
MTLQEGERGGIGSGKCNVELGGGKSLAGASGTVGSLLGEAQRHHLLRRSTTTHDCNPVICSVFTWIASWIEHGTLLSQHGPASATK